MHSICELIRIRVHVKIFQKAGGELTKKKVVRLIDGAQTPVGVIVRTRARTERSQVPERGGLPVVVVVGEAGEARQAALLPLPLASLLLPLLLPPPVLLEELQLAVHLLSSSLLEGVKMALQLLLPFYAFLFVVIALLPTATLLRLPFL